MKKLYEKNELTFAIVSICVYCVVQSAANPLSEYAGINSFFHMIFNVVLTAVLFLFLKKNNLLRRYGLCRSSVPARKFLWYIPLVIIISRNLWNGFAMNLPWMDMVCYMGCMLCVGFLEEVIFRGFLFKAIAKDNIKSAIIISSVTFGVGHLLNLVNGSGMDLAANLCQIFGAIAVGFLFVIIFYHSESLLPCIITHSAVNMVSVFANETGLTAGKQIAFNVIVIGITVTYTLILTKTLPGKNV